MADTFDPYFTWLSIPKDKRPIHFYQLLGLKEFTGDSDVIEYSANRQTAHVKTFLDGEHADDAKAILEQLEQARVCLLDPERKAAYDKGLRVKLGEEKPKTAKPLPQAKPATDRPPAKAPKAPNTRRPAVMQSTLPDPSVGNVASRARPSRKSVLPKIAIAVAFFAAGIGILAVKFWPASDDVANHNDSVQSSTVANVVAANDQSTSPPMTDEDSDAMFGENKTVTNTTASHDNSKLDQPPSAVDPDDTNLQPDSSIVAGESADRVADPPDRPTNSAAVESNDPLHSDRSPAPPVEDPPPASQEVAADQRLPVPDEQKVRETIALAREIYDDELAEAQTPEQQVKLATTMLGVGQATKNDAAERYALFRLSLELATEAGDLALALRAIEQLGADFQIEPWPIREETVTEIAKEVRGRDEMKAAAEAIMDLAEKALREDEFETVETLSDQALTIARRLRGETELVKSVAAFKKLADERAKMVRAQDTALAKLKDNPNDADAHLTVGIYLCLYQGDWQSGLPHLAQGSDADLRAIAEMELAAPDGDDGLLALADAWWDGAEKTDEGVKNLMLARAGHWYEQALPLAKALNKIKAERRLQEITELLADAGPVIGKSRAPAGQLVPKQVVYLDDLKEINFSVGWGTLGKHGQTGFQADAAGATPQLLTFRGEKPAHALSTHPPANGGNSFVEYNLGGDFHLLLGMAGLADKDPGQNRFSDLTFRVIGDNKLLWQSWPLRLDGQHFRVNVAGVRRLRLQVECPGRNANAWAAWFMPRLVEFKSEPRNEDIFAGVHPALHYPLKPHPTGATQFNGHWYGFVPDENANWYDAQRWCEEHGGYLMCIETAVESEFAVRLTNRTRIWLGGVRYDNATWRWVNGSEISFTRWAQGEPNNTGGGENRMNMNIKGDWNDSPHRSDWIKGFVCEWEN